MQSHWWRGQKAGFCDLRYRRALRGSLASCKLAGDDNYLMVSALDVSQTAIDVTKKRLGLAAQQVHWRVADITEAQLEPGAYDVWHDLSVLHFLAAIEQHSAYVRQVCHAVRPGGHVIVSTFGPEGPAKCSGLDTVRYDADSLHDQFGVRFRLVESSKELHRTPIGTTQQFLYCYCKVE